MFPLNVAASAGIDLQASANPGSVSASAPNTPMTTNATTVTGRGGVLPYSYAWTVHDNPGGLTVQINNPSSQTTDFTCTAGLASLETEFVTFRCTVTDANSEQATVDVVAAFERTT